MQCVSVPANSVFHPTSELNIPKNCQTLETIQRNLAIVINTLNGKDLNIVGGSACMILDHLYQQKPLNFRDLDAFVVMDKCTSMDEVQAIADELKSKIPDVLKIDPLLRSLRTPEGVPLNDDSFYFAGKGFLIHRKCDLLPILDIHFFDHVEDLEEVNGVFKQDSIFIVLNEKRSFAQFVEQARKKPFEKLVEEGWVRQPLGAYQDWKEGKLELRNWEDINRKPHVLAIRIVRALNKKGLLEQLLVPAQVKTDLKKQWADLNQIIASNCGMDHYLQSLMFERCLKDKGVALELKALCQLGVFDKWLPFLQNILCWRSVDEIEKIIVTSSQTTPESKLLSLMRERPLSEQLHTLFFALGGPAKIEHTSKIIWRLIKENYSEFSRLNAEACEHLISIRCERDAKTLAKCFTRILNSVSLHENEKCHLLLRTLVANYKDLTSLFPNEDSSTLNNWWHEIEKPRIGFYTGIFNPLTNTHTQIIAHAIDQMHLDKVIVTPTYMGEMNLPCLPWEDRWTMAHIGLKEIPEAQVIGKEFEPALKKNIGTAFTNLKNNANAAWIHIAGTDAFERFKYMNFFDDYLEENIRLFVVKRIGLHGTSLPPKYEHLVSHFSPDSPLGITGILSARDIRRMVFGGQDISGTVPHGVHRYIQEHNLYSPPPAMKMPWQITAPALFSEIIKQQLPFANIRSSDNIDGDSKGIQNAPADGNSNPHLHISMEEIPTGKRLTAIYQQSHNDKPKTLSMNCLPHQTMQTATDLLQTMIHELIGHHKRT